MKVITQAFLWFNIFSLFCYSQISPVKITIDRDGIILQGRFFASAENKGNHKPTVILLAGFPGGERDVLGIGEKLSEAGFNALTFNYTGTYKSQGLASFENQQKDIKAAFDFIRNPVNIDKYKIDTSRIYLGGWCHGGGMALAYASKHPEVTSVFSVAGNDFGEFLRLYKSNTQMKNVIDKMFDDLISKPEVARFEKGAMPFEMAEAGLEKMDTIFDIRKNASLLAKKNILLIGGWDDEQIKVDNFLLPLYRALQKSKAERVRIVTFQDDHYFKNTREDVAKAIIDWLKNL